MAEKNKPVKKFRAQKISVAIWANEQTRNDETYINYSVTMQKSIMVNGEWQETNILFSNELPIAMMLLNKAYSWILLDRKLETV